MRFERPRTLVDQGVDFIKVQANLSPEAHQTVIDEATALGVPVHGHVPDALTAGHVSAAGQRTSEPGVWPPMATATTEPSPKTSWLRSKP